MKSHFLLSSLLMIVSIAFCSCDKREDPFVEEEKEALEIVSLPKTRLSLDETQMKNIGPSNDFSFKYFRNNLKDGENLFLSPLGIQTVIAMSANYGKASEDLCEFLGFGKGHITEINDYYKNLIGNLQGDNFKKELTLANSIMADSGAKKYPSDFLGILRDYYYADYLEIEAKSLLEQPVGDRPEDLWCKDKTGGLIGVAPFPITKNESSFLNAFCFYGQWKDKFDKEMTREDLFFATPETTVTVPMMNKTAKFKYHKNEDFKAVSLPFGDGTFELSVFLPNSEFNLRGMLANLNNDTWDKMRTGMVNTELALTIPCFTATCEHQVILADDSLPEGIGILGQKTVFKMDEDGASAAAVTQNRTPTAPEQSGNKTQVFKANTPFLYTISETGSGLVLFIGVFSGKEEA